MKKNNLIMALLIIIAGIELSQAFLPNNWHPNMSVLNKSFFNEPVNTCILMVGKYPGPYNMSFCPCNGSDGPFIFKQG